MSLKVGVSFRDSCQSVSTCPGPSCEAIIGGVVPLNRRSLQQATRTGTRGTAQARLWVPDPSMNTARRGNVLEAPGWKSLAQQFSSNTSHLDRNFYPRFGGRPRKDSASPVNGSQA
jgi:hypothetical protein